MPFILIMMFLLIYFSAIGFSVLVYVLESIGISTMLKKCGYDKPWLSWIPGANIFAFGKLAEYYDNGKPRKKIGVQLLVLTIAMVVVFMIIYIVMVFNMIASLSADSYTAEMLQQNVYEFEMMILAKMLPYMFVIFAVEIVYFVFYYIAIWKILRIFCPEHAVGLLLLCIFVSPALPFVFFAIRKNVPQNLRQPERPEQPPFYPPYGGMQYPPYNNY